MSIIQTITFDESGNHPIAWKIDNFRSNAQILWHFFRPSDIYPWYISSRAVGSTCCWAVTSCYHTYISSSIYIIHITNSGQAVMYYIQYKNAIKSGHCSYSQHFFLQLDNSRFYKKYLLNKWHLLISIYK